MLPPDVRTAGRAREDATIIIFDSSGADTFAVVPVLIGPAQALLAILPGLLAAVFGGVVARLKPSAIKHTAQILWRQKLQVLIFAGVVTGLVCAWIYLVPSWHAATAAQEAGTTWSAFRGGPSRRGAVIDERFSEPGNGTEPEWSWKGIPSIYSSPCVVGNRVYVTSAELGPFTDRGGVHCFNADDGKLVWEYTGSGFRATYSSPAVAGRYLVVGEGLHKTGDARVFCIDVEESEKKREGVLLWSHRTNSHVESSPCIDLEGSRAFIGAGDDGWYCFRLEPQKTPEDQVLWHMPGNKTPGLTPEQAAKAYYDSETSPVYADGKVYFGLGLGGVEGGGQAVCCLDANDGKELWRVNTPYPAFGSPALAGNILVAGMGNGDMVYEARDSAETHRKRLREWGASEEAVQSATRGLDQEAGEIWYIDIQKAAAAKSQDELQETAVVWKFKAGGTVLGSIAADPEEKEVYFCSRDRYVYRLGLDDRRELSRWNARQPLVTSPAVAEHTVYVVTRDGRICALDRGTFSPVWQAALGSPGPLYISSPVVARGHVYVGTGGDGLLCIGRPGREKPPPVWAGHLGGERAGWADGSPLPDDGRFAWRWPRSWDGSPEPAVQLATPLAVVSMPRITASAREGGTIEPSGTVAVEYGGAKHFSVKPAPGWRLHELLIDNMPGAESLSCDFRNVKADHTVEARFAKEDGSAPPDTPAAEAVDVEMGAAFYAGLTMDGKTGVARLRARQSRGPDGRALREAQVVWFRQTELPVTLSPAATHEYVFFVEGSIGQPGRMLRRLSAATGEPAGAPRPVEPEASGVLLLERRDKVNLYVADGAQRLSRLDAAELDEVWRVDVGRVTGLPVLDGSLMFVATDDPARIVCLDASAGIVLWSADLGAAPASGPVLAGGAVWVNGGSGLLGFDVLNGAPVADAGSGASTTPIAVSGSRLAVVNSAGELAVVDAGLSLRDVYVRWPATEGAGKVECTVKTSAGTERVTLDQADAAAGRWQRLGAWTFAADGEAYVQMVPAEEKDGGAGTVAADAVFFARSGAAVDPALGRPRDGVLVDDSDRKAELKGSARQVKDAALENGGGTILSKPKEGGASAKWKAVLPPTGVVTARASGASAAVPPVLCGDAALYLHEGGAEIWRCDVAAGQGRLWLKLLPSWGKVSTPMVVFDSSVLFGTDQKGLICAERKR